jgi:FtsH-binding integral membrane protein
MDAELTHPFPLIRAGGAFLLVAGFLFALGWIWPKRFSIFMAMAFGLGGFCAYGALALPPDLGPPSALHIAVLIGAIAFEIIAVLWIYRTVKDERRQDGWVLFWVGAHFAPMAILLGPLALVLAGLTMANAALALWALRQAPILPFGLADSAIKILIGAALLFVYPRFGAAFALTG